MQRPTGSQRPKPTAIPLPPRADQRNRWLGEIWFVRFPHFAEGGAAVPAQKKDPSVRARRNKAATASALTPSSAPVPAMPDGPAWHVETVKWWTAVWSSPMRSEWDESDAHNVVLCALIYNDIWTAETAKERKDAAAEFRLQRQSLGLSPYDRRRLEWTIETAEDAKDRGQRRRGQAAPPVTPSAADDPRLKLVQ